MMSRRWMTVLFRAGAGLAAATTLLLGVLEYQQRGRMQQARETMALIDTWEDKGARQAYGDLASALELIMDTEVSAADLAAARADWTAYAKLRSNLSRSVLRDPIQAENMDLTIYFFTRLSLCIEAELCDARVANTFFGDTVDSFLAAFRPAILARQNVRKGYGQSVLDLQNLFQTETP